ncbi:uncharacterized protein FTOL_06964 [Fusarium torulosum]|uniref:Uncharacterized protein n=1 Tax=Fusarium torulosum TaxID=33205 RepID=A0AAE8MB49_9HYPO|nr:uncharacterized protein FTOL_06964 [Fusarium torulosum]
MVERKFQLIDEYIFDRTYHGIPLSKQWQAWETAHFLRVKSIVKNPNIVSAYIIQLVLVLFLSLCFKLTASWIRTFGRITSSLQKGSSFREICNQWQTAFAQTRFYTLFFVVLSWILMTVITEFQEFNAAEFEQHLKQVSNVGPCGDMPGPMSFCQGIKDRDSYEFFSLTLASRFAVHIIVSCLIIDWAVHFANNRLSGGKIKYAQISGETRSLFAFAETKGIKLFLGVFWAAVELLTVSLIFIGLRELVELLDMHQADGGLSTWGFGQLVAVAIWFPIMIKFITLNIVGPKKEVKQLEQAQRPQALEMVSYSYNKANDPHTRPVT